jgi:nitronate monooxygenase
VWPDTAIIRLFGTAVPIVQAPMAGETDRPELVAAVSNAGGLGSTGVAYLQPEAVRQRIHAIRALTGRPFAVNLFAPVASDMSPGKIDRARALLAPLRAAYGLEDIAAVTTMPDFEAQLAVVLEEKPAVSSPSGRRRPCLKPRHWNRSALTSSSPRGPRRALIAGPSLRPSPTV